MVVTGFFAQCGVVRLGFGVWGLWFGSIGLGFFFMFYFGMLR